jgi:hypothetical protein
VAHASRLGHQDLTTSRKAVLRDENNGQVSGSSLGFLVLVVNVTAQQAGAAAHSRADGRGARGQADERPAARA